MIQNDLLNMFWMYFNILFFKKMLFKKRRIIMQQPNIKHIILTVFFYKFYV
jgi:hypothetical protein